MLILGTADTATQTVLSGATINLGTTYRKYCKKNSAGTTTFTNNGESISLNQSGIYHLTATFIGSGTVAGNATIRMYVNGVAIPRAFSTETISTADTELRTFVIDDYILVDTSCVLGRTATTPANITFVNEGVGATFTLAKVNVDKVL